MNYLVSLRNLVVLVALAACTSQGRPAERASKDDYMDKRVEELMAQMTLEEKVGQMNQYNGFWDATGPAPKGGDAKTKYEHLRKGWVGSVLNVTGVEKVRELQRVAVEESRLGIPLIFGLDVIHGHSTMAPIPLAEAASFDLRAIEQSARVAAVEASAVGVNWTFAPMVDISRDARWGRSMEGAGEDPYYGSLVGQARVRGFQGNDLAAANTVIACAKHFAGYGFAESGKDYNAVDVGTTTLYNTILPPFKAASDAGVRTFMNAFNTLNGIPATADEFLMRDILKERWGFDGFVVSDWASAKDMIEHGYAEDLKHAAELSARAGMDMDMEAHAYVDHLADMVRAGTISEALVDDAVRRILKIKFELDLFDDPYKYCNEEREQEMLLHEDHMAAALDMAKRSMVLLKNEERQGKALLPLAKGKQPVAVIGALAADKNSPLGNWRAAAKANTAVSVLEGLEAYGANVNYAKGADVVLGDTEFIYEVKVNTTDRSGFAKAIAAAKKSEVVIMVLGEQAFMSGEARSRADIGLPGVQQELLEAVHAVNPNIVLVLMNGRPLALPWAHENVPTILEAWHLGHASGTAIAQVLYGDYNPSGKLPMTFPRNVAQVPIYYNHLTTGRPGPQEMIFWSHYMDMDNAPLYPFGHGLSYTRFEYSNLSIAPQTGGNVKVSVQVRNMGERAGEEVTQLYIRDRVAQVARPVKELKGFEKFMLQPGEARQVVFTLTEAELGYFNGRGEWLTDPGTFDIMVGTSSTEGLTGSFEWGVVQ